MPEQCEANNNQTKCSCAWLWLSGFFTMPAFVHLVRILSGWHVRIGEYDVPMKISWIALIIFGILSIACALAACRKK